MGNCTGGGLVRLFLSTAREGRLDVEKQRYQNPIQGALYDDEGGMLGVFLCPDSVICWTELVNIEDFSCCQDHLKLWAMVAKNISHL